MGGQRVQVETGRGQPAAGLTPAAFDRWWRDRIEKEEGPSSDVIKLKASIRAGVSPEVTIPGDHLLGAGALVKPRLGGTGPEATKQLVKRIEATRNAGSTAGSAASVKAKSSASGLTNVKSTAAAASVANAPLSVISASSARTPSLAPHSATSSVIASRLARLEQELVREKILREAAEKEMQSLLDAAQELANG